MNKNLKRIDTRNMSREEWLQKRRELGIGGSDATIIVGSPYRSRYSLFLEKTEKVIPEDISDREAVRLGNDLEDYVAKRFAEATGKKVQKCNAILQNPDYPFAFANPDRLIVGENAGLECKTSSSYEVCTECKNGFPARYYAQCTHYMLVTGAERWYLAVCCFGRGFYWFCLERNEAEIAALADLENEFWQMCLDGEGPELDGSESTTEAVRDLYPQDDGSDIDLMPVSGAIVTYQAASQRIKELEEMKTEAQNQICAYLGEAASGSYGGHKVTWKTQERSTLDKKSLEKDHPGLLDQYTTKTSSRVFRFK